MDRSSSGNSGRGSAETARGSDNSTVSGGEDRPKIVLYSTNNSIDDDDAHSELDPDLYDMEDVPDSWDQQFSIGGSILSEPSTTTPHAAGFATNMMPAQAFHQSQMAAQQRGFHQSRHDETAMSDTSSRERRRVLTYETMSSNSSQNYRVNRMPMDHQPYIRTNFTTQDVGTPSDPYEMLGTPPGDPPSTRPDEMPTLEAEVKQPRTMNAQWVFGIMILWFIVGGISLSLNPPAELGYWLDVVGNLYIRAVNCVTLPMAFCQVVVSVATLTSKNTLAKLWFKTLGIFLGICALSVLAAIGIAHAFRPLMKEQQSLGLTLTHHKFAFKCSNNKYFLQEPDGSLSCTGNAVQANTTFPWLVDIGGGLGLDESVSAVDLTGYIFTLFGTYFPNNFVAKLSKDNFLSSLIIATVIGVAVTKSFRGLQSRSNPLLRLVMHIYSSLFSMLDFMQSAFFIAMCPMLIGSVLVSPNMGHIMTLTKYYCLSAGLLAIVHCLLIVPAVFFLFTKRNPYTWLLRVATPILYAMVLQSAFLPLSVATKAVMRTKEVPPAVFGAIYPPLTALNRCAQAVGLPLVLVYVAAFSGCHVEVDFLNILKLFGVTYIACLGEAELGRSQLAYFLTIWRTICTNEDTPSAILAIATISLLIYRISAVVNTLTNLAIIRMVATTKESKMHARLSSAPATTGTIGGDSVLRGLGGSGRKRARETGSSNISHNNSSDDSAFVPSVKKPSWSSLGNWADKHQQQHFAEPTDQKENFQPAANYSSSSVGNTTSARTMLEPRIIRFGENEEDVFLLKNDDTRRVALVEKLKRDPTSPERWLELLKCPTSYEAKLYSKVRLYRRAIALMQKEDCRHSRSYVEIWILFAKLKGNEKETRDTFKYMKTERIGEHDPMYYETYAAFECKHGNQMEAQDILQLGVVHDAFGVHEKNEIFQRLTSGQLSTSLTQHHLAQHHQLHTPRDHKYAARTYSTPNDTQSTMLSSSTMSTMIATPVSFSHSTSSSTAAVSLAVASSSSSANGFSTVSKAPRSDKKLMITPSVPSRPSKAQTTSRKVAPATSRFYKFGGPPLRVVASTGPENNKRVSETLDEEDDEDDDMMDDSPVMDRQQSRQQKQQENSSTPTESTRPTKKLASDLSYIKNWNPRPLPTTNGHSSSTTTSSAKPATTTNNINSTVRKSIEPVAEPVRQESDRFPSPKRQQIAEGVANTSRYLDTSPLSVSSASSSSSPSLVDNASRDPFSSLSSKFVVNGLVYIKLEQIGSGGSSKVYRMLGPDLKIYALKRIKLKRLDAKSIEQYTNEIQLLDRLQGNPHIIKLVAAEQDLQQRQINVVMEHGEIDLSERLRDIKDSLDENFLRVIWTQMLQAVHAIHSERIIHGDLKPANFLFVNGALKLIDFGIAKAISNDTTNIERDSQVGTVNYMSPEAIQGNAAPSGQRNPSGKMKVGRASDIWSLGCILYQIVYGKPPFADVNSIIEKFRCIIDPSYPIPYPSLKNKELEAVIRSCLQRDHRARPTIDGPGGLLNHPFLRSGGVNAMVSSDTPVVTLANAPQVLNQLADVLRAQGVDNTRVSTFLSIGQQGLRNTGGVDGSGSRQSTNVYRYNNTEERRTEI